MNISSICRSTTNKITAVLDFCVQNELARECTRVAFMALGAIIGCLIASSTLSLVALIPIAGTACVGFIAYIFARFALPQTEPQT